MELKIDNGTMQELVKTEIKLRIAELLSKNTETLVREVVHAAFYEKKDSYGRESVIESTLNKMIRAEADEAMRLWIEQVRPAIRKQMFERLNDKKLGLAQKVSDQLVAGLSGGLNIRVWLGEDR
jgi:hypothetical protein